VTQSDQLKPLWRGPHSFPGYDETLSPGAGYRVVHSASWRVIVDFATQPATAFGIFPGGQSGNPFSIHYDNSIDSYLAFDYFRIDRLLSVPGAASGYTMMTLEP
jgi:penicillin amidase